jgi:hypothetical protein
MKKLESQVCSFTYSFPLNFYKLDIEPCFYWRVKDITCKPVLISNRSKHNLDRFSYFPAYTVAELGEILLQMVENYTVYIYPKDLKFYHGRDQFGTMEASSEADLRAHMLIRALRCNNVKFG